MLKKLALITFFAGLYSEMYAQVVQDSTKTIEIIEFLLCKDVIEREPFEPVSSFSETDEKAWVFARVKNTNGLITLYFNWYLNEALIAEIPVKVGNSKNWRTYSNVNLRKGIWRIELINEDKDRLAELRFNISE